MADVKISALSSASVPVVGTEVLPIVQSGNTVKVAISDLTAGRDMSALSITVPTVQAASSSGGAIKSAAGVTQATWGVSGNNVTVSVATTISPANAIVTISPTGTGTVVVNPAVASSMDNVAVGVTVPLAGNFTTLGATDATDASSTTIASLKTAGGLAVVKKMYIGDNIVTAAAKGISFAANTPAAGMTSQLFNWFETGTWTPTVAGLTTGGTGTGTYTGKYSRVGNVVTATAYISQSNHTGTGAMVVTGLPFAANNYSAAEIGFVTNMALTALNIATGYVGNGGNYINIMQTPIGGGAASTVPIDTAFDLMISVTYLV